MTDNYIKRITIEGGESISTLKEILAVLQQLNRHAEIMTRTMVSMNETLQGMAGIAKATAESVEALNAKIARGTRIIHEHTSATRQAAAASREYAASQQTGMAVFDRFGTFTGTEIALYTAIQKRNDYYEAAWETYRNMRTGYRDAYRTRYQERPQLYAETVPGEGRRRWEDPGWHEPGGSWTNFPGRPARGDGGGGEGGDDRFSMGRHIRWFIEGTVIYYAINSVINAFKGLVDTAVKSTNEWSSAITKFNYVSSGGAPALQQAAIQLQQYGIEPGQAYTLRTLAARGTRTPQEEEVLTKNAGLLMALTEGRVDEAQAIDMLLGIVKQYNMEISDSGKILDVLATMYKGNNMAMEENAESLAAMGSLSEMMGLSLDQMSGFIMGMTEVTDKSGSQIATFMEQMMGNIQNFSRMRTLGIDITGNTPWQTLQQLSALWQASDQGVRNQINEAVGGRRFLSETGALLGNFDMLAQKVQNSSSAAGEAAKMYAELGQSVGASAERAKAARDLYFAMTTTGFGAVRGAWYQYQETQFLGAALSAQVRGMDFGLRKSLADRWAQYAEGAGVTGYSVLEAKNVSMWMRMASPFGLTEGIQRLDPETLRLFQQFLAEQLVSRPLPLIMGGVSTTDTGRLATYVPTVDKRPPLNLYSNEIMTPDAAKRFEGLVEKWQDYFEQDKLHMPSETTTMQILVGKEGNAILKDISASSEAIQMAAQEMNERQRQQGTWNLPGMAIGNLDSFQNLVRQAATSGPIMPLVGGGFMFGEGAVPEGRGVTPPRDRWRKGGPQEGWTVNVPVFLDGRQIGQAVASVHGGDLQSRWEMGEDRGAGYISSTGGVI